jgi:hypothetical protein
MLDKAREDQINNMLAQKGVTQSCLRCRSSEFEILAEAEMPLIANRLDRQSPNFINPVPIVLIACRNCGYMYPHIATLLGVSRLCNAQ